MYKPAIIPRADWGAKPARNTKQDPILKVQLSHRTGFVVHHTVTPSGQTVNDVPAIIRGIQNFHMTARACNDIGYNFLIDKWGFIYEGRGLDWRGAHAGGHNSMNWGVAFIGNNDATLQTRNAFVLLYKWLSDLRGTQLQQLCHSDVNSTACPDTVLKNWVHSSGLETLVKDDSEYGLNVQRTATYLNARRLERTTSANLDGVPSTNYWWLIQTAGRIDGIYPKPFVIDGIAGNKTRECEQHYFKISADIQKRNLQPIDPNAEHKYLHTGQVEGF